MGGDWYLERQKITAKEADTIDYTFDSRELVRSIAILLLR